MEYNLTHDLTVAYLQKNPSEMSPEEFVEKYFELFPKISKAIQTHNEAHPNTVKTFSRSKLGL